MGFILKSGTLEPPANESIHLPINMLLAEYRFQKNGTKVEPSGTNTYELRMIN